MALWFPPWSTFLINLSGLSTEGMNYKRDPYNALRNCNVSKKMFVYVYLFYVPSKDLVLCYSLYVPCGNID